jgi:hypothetical protein
VVSKLSQMRLQRVGVQLLQGLADLVVQPDTSGAQLAVQRVADQHMRKLVPADRSRHLGDETECGCLLDQVDEQPPLKPACCLEHL